MCSLRKWVLTLGMLTATAGIATAGPLSFLGDDSESQSKPSGADSQQTANRVAQALRGTQLRGHDIKIDVVDGTATLTGHVANAQQKDAVTKLVVRVPGVKAVSNQLTTADESAGNGGTPSAGPTRGAPKRMFGNKGAAPAGSNNQQVAQTIADALSNSRLDGYDIEIQFQGGVALLGGTVADRAQWAKATRVASSIPGVQAVNNQMSIAGQPQGPNPNVPVQNAMQRNGRGVPYVPAAYQPGASGGPGAPGFPGPNGLPPATHPAPPYPGAMPPVPGAGMPPVGPEGSQMIYNMPNVPENAWPTYASYPNYAQVTYPQQYSASAWPYMGPFYPYPQVPLGWRKVQLEWDDGQWALNFNPRTDRWWWFLDPHNW